VGALEEVEVMTTLPPRPVALEAPGALAVASVERKDTLPVNVPRVGVVVLGAQDAGNVVKKGTSPESALMLDLEVRLRFKLCCLNFYTGCLVFAHIFFL
jgi:hypothetical protein